MHALKTIITTITKPNLHVHECLPLNAPKKWPSYTNPKHGHVIRWAADTEWRERAGGPDGGHLGEGRRPGTEKTVYMNKK